MLVSIIITNYNYGRFLRDAIDSALAVRHDRKEIIVVDDGSTDDSGAIIASYGSAVTAILKPNGGQPSAANVGFAQAHGDIVFFLDSDDMLLPEAAEKIIAVWRDGISKVQFPMLNCDSEGRLTGTMFPNFTEAPEPSMVRRMVLSTGLYPTPPTTGNAFARWFLQKIFPVPERVTEGFDSFMNPAAPLFGDVVTVLRPLAKYRIHGKNSWAQQTFVPEKLAFYVQQDLARTDYLRRIVADQGLTMDPDPLRHNVPHQMFRLACKRMVPHLHPINETRWTILRNGLAAAFQSPMKMVPRLITIVWMLGVGCSPHPVAAYLVQLRFAAASRPRAMVRLLQTLRVLRRAPVHS